LVSFHEWNGMDKKVLGEMETPTGSGLA
jgi:hypothetical protein